MRTRLSLIPAARRCSRAELQPPHRRRVDGERLEPAETRRARRQPERADQSLGRVVAAAQLDAQHAGESLHLPAGQLVLRVRLEPRVVDLRDPVVRGEKARQRQPVLVVARDSQPERPQAPQQQPAVERAERGPGDDGELPGPRDELARADDDPGRDVVMPAQVLRRAVDDDVDADARAAAG